MAFPLSIPASYDWPYYLLGYDLHLRVLIASSDNVARSTNLAAFGFLGWQSLLEASLLTELVVLLYMEISCTCTSIGHVCSILNCTHTVTKHVYLSLLCSELEGEVQETDC